MCGISGVLALDQHQVMGDVAQSMIEKIKHRGPDRQGVWKQGPVQLASARLSIQDVNKGHQPMLISDEKIVGVYNGEISNFQTLRQSLKSKGYSFKTRSDTEVLLKLYEDLGADLLPLLNGQFSFAIFDRRKKKLLLARDRYGICPLYIFQTPQDLYFASEIKAFLVLDSFKPTFNASSIFQSLRCWSALPPKTVFSEVEELKPGWAMEIDATRQARQWSYCSLNDWFGNVSRQSEGDLKETLNQKLRGAIKNLLVSDVPVASYLSGGIDSAIIAHLAQEISSKPVTTFSVEFEDPAFDESKYQNIARQGLTGDHVSIRCGLSDIEKVFPDVTYHAEKPLFRTAPAPLYLLSRAVREHGYKVVLTGEGADEVFWGYDTYRELFIRRMWARNADSKIRPKLLKEIFGYLPQYKNPRTFAFLTEFYRQTLSQTESPFYSMLPRWQNGESLFHLMHPDHIESFKKENMDEQMGATLSEELKGLNAFEKCQILEMKFLLGGYLLSSQGDRMLAANSVEGRYPYLDNDVVSFAAKLPVLKKVKGLHDKYLLRETFQQIPKDIRQRKKFAYRAPEAKAFLGAKKSSYVDEMLSSRAIQQAGVFNEKKIGLLKSKCERAAATGFLTTRDNMALTFVLSTQLLYHYFHQRESA